MSSKSTKTTTENKPPEWAAPLFAKSASEAEKLYDKGVGGAVYQGSTVAPMSGASQTAVNNLFNAGGNTNTSQTRGTYNYLANAGVNNPLVSKINAVGDRAGAPTAASQYLTATARGDYLDGEGNPFYRQRLEREIGDANAMIQSQFAGSGRYGSGANQRAIADNTSNMLLSGLEADYNRERQNQLAAVGMLDSANQGALALQGSMYGNANAARATGLDQAFRATSAQTTIDQNQFANRLAGAQAQMTAGQTMDAQAQKELADRVAKFYANDLKDWNRLGLLQTAAAGSAGNYGTQQSIQRQPFNWLQAIGTVGSMFI